MNMRRYGLGGDKAQDEADSEGLWRDKASIDRCVTLLSDTFGDDHWKVRHVRRKVEEFSNALGVGFAARYAQWGARYPELIGEDPATQSCYCPESGGWVPEKDENGVEVWRPCTRCNDHAVEGMRQRAERKRSGPGGASASA